MMKIRIAPRKEAPVSALREKLQKADIATIGHYTEFGFMNPRIRYMCGQQDRVYGNAVTVRIPAEESKALHLAVSLAQEGDILVIDRCGDTTHAPVGEMIALCSSVRKLSAIIVDGPMTDIEEIREIGIPVFATGVSALTTKFIHDCGEINYDISCGGVPVHPGDLIMADRNGVLVLREFEAEALLDAAIEDQKAEAQEKQEVIGGMTLQQLYVKEYPL